MRFNVQKMIDDDSGYNKYGLWVEAVRGDECLSLRHHDLDDNEVTTLYLSDKQCYDLRSILNDLYSKGCFEIKDV